MHASVKWTCESNAVTLHLYIDEMCNSQMSTDTQSTGCFQEDGQMVNREVFCSSSLSSSESSIGTGIIIVIVAAVVVLVCCVAVVIFGGCNYFCRRSSRRERLPSKLAIPSRQASLQMPVPVMIHATKQASPKPVHQFAQPMPFVYPPQQMAEGSDMNVTRKQVPVPMVQMIQMGSPAQAAQHVRIQLQLEEKTNETNATTTEDTK